MRQGSELKVKISLTLGWVLGLPAVLTLGTYLGTNRPDNLMTSPGVPFASCWAGSRRKLKKGCVGEGGVERSTLSSGTVALLPQPGSGSGQ